ncbi:AAA-domain-containing protein [Backusella circina FSU 941]|nr:AAA-domain-containing protein [Backusella circina FSU 941]
MVQRRLTGHVISLGKHTTWHIGGRLIKCTILSPQETHKVSCQTTIQIAYKTITQQHQLYDPSLIDMINTSFEQKHLFTHLHLSGGSILIHGPAGIGKSTLIQKSCEHLGLPLFRVSCYSLFTFSDNEYERMELLASYNPLRLAVNRAMSVPSVVALFDLDILDNSDKTSKVLSLIENEMTRIKEKDVFFIGVASQLNKLPEALKKNDLFQQHMKMPIPSLQERAFLLKQMLSNIIQQDDIEEYTTQISIRTSGYLAQDLSSLIQQARLKSLRRKSDLSLQMERLSLSSQNSVIWADFEYALDQYRPLSNSQAPAAVAIPKRTWQDIGGYTAIKDRVKQAVLLPLLQPHIFTKLGIKPPSGLLLYGPTGCGKTVLAQALANESTANVISIQGPEIFSKYLGETEKKIRNIFSTAKKMAPCIVFIDELDSICAKRGLEDSGGGVNERVLSTLLNEMDGVEGRPGVVVIGCTNQPDQIDDAILRPGRLDHLIYLGLPTLEDRMDIIKSFMRKTPTSDDIDIHTLANQTEFCTGADIENLFREAGTFALRNDINANQITKTDIEAVLGAIREKAEDQVLEGRLDVYERFLHDHTL